MSYFDNVYLKRINKYGFNIQERIQNQKIHDFDVVLNKSPNKVTVYKDYQIYLGILENKTNSEKEVIDYLLTYKNIKWDDGTIIVTEESVSLQQKRWLIFHLDEYVSIGYSRYQIIQLDRDIRWIDDGILYSEHVHFTGSGSNLRDKSITSKFSIQDGNTGVYLPNKILNLVMKTNPKMNKGTRILIGDEVWKVSGIDKISVPGVSYVTLEEDYLDKEDDKTVANVNKLADWSIQSSYGQIIKVLYGREEEVKFTLFYNDEIREEPIMIDIEDTNIAIFSNGIFAGLAEGETKCTVSLISTPEVKQDFKISVVTSKEESFVIVGPEKIKVSGLFTYQILGDSSSLSLYSKNDNFEVVNITGNTFVIRGEKIGEDKIMIERNSTLIYEKEIEIESIWMEG